MGVITTVDGRRAATEYAARRRRAIAYGTWRPDLVDAEPARQHVRALSAGGIGYLRTAQLAGVPYSVVNRLIYGTREAPPSVRIRATTEAKLLAVPPDNRAERAFTSTTGTVRRMRALAAIGWTFSAQAVAIGWTVGNYHNIFTRRYVTVATARTVGELYDRWSMTTPEPGYGSDRARATAARSRWLPPLAWDDETIDDADATPVVLPPVAGSLPVDEVALAQAVLYLEYPIPADVRDEIIHRLAASGYPNVEIARIARTTPPYVSQIRSPIGARLATEQLAGAA
jgi:DNA-binding CsgD family transcriptional regulator